MHIFIGVYSYMYMSVYVCTVFNLQIKKRNDFSLTWVHSRAVLTEFAYYHTDRTPSDIHDSCKKKSLKGVIGLESQENAAKLPLPKWKIANWPTASGPYWYKLIFHFSHKPYQTMNRSLSCIKYGVLCTSCLVLSVSPNLSRPIIIALEVSVSTHRNVKRLGSLPLFH